ncbi:MAG: alkaline phosphatase [Bdellovibrionales bacterium]
MKSIVMFCIFLSLPAIAKQKSMILFIGDGMGPQQISMLHYYLKYSKANVQNPVPNAFKRMADKGEFGSSSTAPAEYIVVDSACSATQLSTGHPSLPGMIGVNSKGDSVETILQKLKARGYRTGVISDTRITHATPAAFVSNQPSRKMDDEIASDFLKTQPDIAMSSGSDYFLPKGVNTIVDGISVAGKRKDNQDLLKQARDLGYKVIGSKSTLHQGKTGKVLALFGGGSMPDSLWQIRNENNKERNIPNLLEMTEIAIQNLTSSNKPFFLMVEAGQIDWAGHRNDSGALLHEMINANRVLNYLVDFVESREDVTLVATADHETGSFGFSYNKVKRTPGIKLKGSHFKGESYEAPNNYLLPDVFDLLGRQKFTNTRLMKKFEALPKSKQNAKSIQSLIKESIGITVSLKDAESVLKTTTRKFFGKKKEISLVHDFHEFYASRNDAKVGLIGRILSKYQGTVWGTGGHTATPVHVYSMGAGDLRKFGGYTDHVELGKNLKKHMGL